MPHPPSFNSFGSIRVKTPLVLPRQRIGVMGGSFNPPHEGHAIVASTALKRLELDQLWWLVTPGNPLKSHNGLAPLTQRMAACTALANDPRMHVTAFEAQLKTPYTAATLGFLAKRYPGATFIWIMGADNLATFHRWQHWSTIASELSIAVVDRPGWRLKSPVLARCPRPRPHPPARIRCIQPGPDFPPALVPAFDPAVGCLLDPNPRQTGQPHAINSSHRAEALSRPGIPRPHR